MSSKINITKIIKDHWNTLYNYRTNRFSVADLLQLFVVPTILGTTFALFVPGTVPINSNFFNAALTSLSIFAGLLVNVIVLIYDAIQKTVKNNQSTNNNVRIKFLGELSANISFTIVLSIISIAVFLVISSVNVDEMSTIISNETRKVINRVVSSIVYSIVLIFLSHLLLVVKRIYHLLRLDIPI